MIDRVQIGDWCTLYHADSVEIVADLRALNPDAVITDPPYGIGLNDAGGGNKSPGGFGSKTVMSDHAGPMTIAGDRDGADVRPWLAIGLECIVWGADHLRRYLPERGGRFIAWDKTAGHEFHDDFSNVEFAWHSRKGAAGLIHHLWKGGIKDPRGGDRGSREHPMQKPIRLMEWCIDECRLEPGALILDPYMGSGTTAIAAFKKRMSFVGVEIDRRWFDVAVERINRQTGDGPLFDAVAGAQDDR